MYSTMMMFLRLVLLLGVAFCLKTEIHSKQIDLENISELLNSTILDAMGAALNKLGFNCSRITQSCREIGCNNLSSSCLGAPSYKICAQVCKCDEICVHFGDCCFDYWHFCKGLNDLIYADTPGLSKLSKNAIESLQETNNSLTALIKYRINNFHVNSRMKYFSCTEMSSKYGYNFWMIKRCPSDTLKDGIIKERCEGPDYLTFAPVYNHDVGIFKNQHCVICHDLDPSDFIPMPLSFMCDQEADMEKVDEEIYAGSFTAARKILFDKCKFSVELLKTSQQRGTPGLKKDWILRQSCVDRQPCPGCEILCNSFITVVLPHVLNPFYYGCSLSALNTVCSSPTGGRTGIPTLPSYTMLFSVTDKTLPSFRKFKSFNIYDTYCNDKGKFDLLTDGCVNLNASVILQNNVKIYSPKREIISEGIRTIPIMVKEVKSAQKHFLMNEDFKNFQQSDRCDSVIRNQFIRNNLWKNESQLHQKLCIISNKTFDDLMEAIQFGKKLIARIKDLQEVMIHNVDLKSNNDLCEKSDQKLMVKTHAFKVSGEIMLAAVVGDETYMLMVNESFIVGKLKMRSGNKPMVSMFTILCKRGTIEGTYLGLVTTLCNSLSLTFLFITLSLFVLRKSIRSKVVSSIPQLSSGLFCAQLLFQISHVQLFISRPGLCRIIGMLQHYFWLTCFLMMSFISLDFWYRFSNICRPWFTKKRKEGKMKLCWIIGALLMSVPICLDNFTDWPLAYSSSSGICFIEPQVYLIGFFIGPSMFFFSVNILCFIANIINICNALPSDVDIAAAADRNMVLIFTKIAGLMGVTWLFALVPYITGIEELWYVFVVANGLQGLYIFLSSGVSAHLVSEIKEAATSITRDSQD